MWRNRDQVAKELKKAVASANAALKLALLARRGGGGGGRDARGNDGSLGGPFVDGRPFVFVDLGHAENLGQDGDCVHSGDQVGNRISDLVGN